MLLGAVGAAAALAVALCLPLVWWAPLNVDEEITRAIAPRSPGSIWHIVWGERGGGPLHFYVEHLTLRWPGGLEGLRLPSLFCFVLTIPATAALARELAGGIEAVVASLLVATAPLAFTFATFGRPHVLLMMWIAWALWAAVVAARIGDRRWWLVGALALASSVFVHPIAPIFAAAGLAAALVYAPRPPRAVVREAWPAVLAFALVLVPYYVHTLRVLKHRYAVGSGRRGRTYSGNSVLHDAITAFATTNRIVNVFSLLALGGVVVLVRRGRRRAAAVPVVMVAAPIVFFSFVPSSGRSALFFSRYMLPALPVFVVLLAAACVELVGLLPRWRVAGLAAIVVALSVVQLRHDVSNLKVLRNLRLGEVVQRVSQRRDGAVLFGATGTIGPSGYIGRLSYGRPPVLMDQYLGLRVAGLRRVDDSSCVPAVRMLAGPQAPRRGLWLFYAASDDEAEAGAAALPSARRIATRFLLVESGPLRPRALLERGLILRRKWHRAVPRDFKVAFIVYADEQALRDPSGCRPLGEFGDPDITPAKQIPLP